MSTRRHFLGGAAALCLTPLAGRAHPMQDAPAFSISLAQWSLHRTLRDGKLSALDFPAKAKALGFGAVEYVNSFFVDRVGDKVWLEDLRGRCRDLDIQNLLIMCDGLGALGDPDAAARTQAIERHLPWLDAAKTLGCHSIRVNAQSDGTRDEQTQRAADGLRRLAEQGDQRGLNVIVENHGGLSSDGSWLAGVMAAVDHPRIGTLPDFGNFHLGEGKWYDRYQGVKELMPYAKAVSAKSHAFDDQGNETGTDYGRMLGIVLDSGYRGWIGVEYEGADLDEERGILLTKALLERLRAARTAK